MAVRKKLVRRVEIEKSIPEIYEEFQNYNKVKNLSEQTITYYYWNLKHLFDYLDEKKITKISDISSSTIDDYILWLKEKYSNSITINTYLRSARVFLYYATKKGYLNNFKICLIKQEEKVIKTYSDDDILKLIKKPNLKTCSFVEHRNWVLINFFIETGCRLRSVLNIKVSDLNLPERKIILRITKNREQLEIPLTKTLVCILPEFIEIWGLGQDSYLFPNAEGIQMSDTAIKASIALYNKKRGVKITSIHAFRHTFARNYILTNGLVFKLQSLLGHKDLTMTRHYVHLFGEDLAKDIDEHSIIGRIKPTTSRFTKASKNK